ncbi:MAG: TerB family tellurite resistance protein [Myxococcales bacterium]|nr:TerB family tellurite resistance protein [Polyangiaceae bacterium]MDW8251671.1 TerB family tellurite resistance protein [Myxococcales bacterium]
MDDALRRQVCRLIAGLVVSDDDLDEKEEAFLERLLARFGIPSSERDTIFPIVDRADATEAMKALPPEAQQEAMTLLIEAAAADGKIAPEEQVYLATVAAVVNLDEAMLNSKIQAALGSSVALPWRPCASPPSPSWFCCSRRALSTLPRST